MKRKFCCDASRGLYEDYYVSQSGSGLPVFRGSRGQAGHGLGSIFSGLFRSALPLLKNIGLKIGKAFGKQALKTGAQIATDVAEGQPFVDSAKRRVNETIKQYVPSYGEQDGSGMHIKRFSPPFYSQSGSGKRRRRTSKNKSKKAKKDVLD